MMAPEELRKRVSLWRFPCSNLVGHSSTFFVYNVGGTNIISVSLIENRNTEIKTYRLLDVFLRLRRNTYVVPLCKITCLHVYLNGCRAKTEIANWIFAIKEDAASITFTQILQVGNSSGRKVCLLGVEASGTKPLTYVLGPEDPLHYRPTEYTQFNQSEHCWGNGWES